MEASIMMGHNSEECCRASVDRVVEPMQALLRRQCNAHDARLLPHLLLLHCGLWPCHVQCIVVCMHVAALLTQVHAGYILTSLCRPGAMCFLAVSAAVLQLLPMLRAALLWATARCLPKWQLMLCEGLLLAGQGVCAYGERQCTPSLSIFSGRGEPECRVCSGTLAAGGLLLTVVCRRA